MGVAWSADQTSHHFASGLSPVSSLVSFVITENESRYLSEIPTHEVWPHGEEGRGCFSISNKLPSVSLFYSVFRSIRIYLAISLPLHRSE